VCVFDPSMPDTVEIGFNYEEAGLRFCVVKQGV